MLKTEELIEISANKWGRGEIKEAIELYEEIIKNNSVNLPPWIYYRVGIAYQKEGDLEKAIQLYKKAIQLKPKKINWKFSLVECYERQGKLDAAIAITQKIIDLKPQSYQAHFTLGRLQFLLNNIHQALVAFEAAILINPHHYNDLIYRRILNSIKKEGDIDNYINRYLNLSRQYSDNPGFLIILGDIFYSQEYPQTALNYYYQAQELGLIQSWLFQRIEKIFLDLEQIESIEIKLQQLVKDYPDKPLGLEGLARVAMRTKRFDLAVKRWTELIEQFPHKIIAYEEKAKALNVMGQIDEAKGVLRTLATKYSDKPHGLRGLGELATKQREWKEALEYWDLCLAQFPHLPNTGVKIERANCLIQLERQEEATAIFQDIVKKYPYNSNAWLGLAKIARISINLKQALEYCNYIEENFPNYKEVYREKQEILIEMGKFKEANQAFLNLPFHSSKIYKSKKHSKVPQELVFPELQGVDNDYSFIVNQVEELVSQGSPCILTVSIIITVYSQHLNLAKVLAALTHQTYPQNLMEIIIVDDGNSSEISQIVSKYQKYLNLIHLNQNNLIHSVYAARNLAIQAAKHDYLITLDCNLLPEPKLVESYMKFFHVTDQAILIGNLQSACLNNITDDEILNNFNTNFCLDLMIPHNQIEQEFINSQIEADLKLNFSEEHNYKKDQRWSFRGFTGVNAAYPKKAHQEAGYYNPNLFDHNLLGCSEADAEMGYRFYNAGYYFIPVRDSLSLYSSSIQDKNKLEITPPINNKISQLSEKCPAPFYRPYQPGKLYQVPKVSIYIPVYNREKYIKQAIDSALNQTYTDLEVCICNDGSTDNTLKIIEDNYSDNPRVRWISQPNRGISNASNNAVKMCRGMYIGHLDSDDFLKPHAVELAVNYLDNHNVGCICCSSNEIVDEAGNYVRNFSFHVEFSREAFLVGNMALPFRMFRKRDWNRTSGFDESLPSAEDYDLYLKLSEVCYFHHLDSANYCYRWHGGNISLEGRRAQEKSHIIIINKALARLGLSNKWKAISASLTNVRDVKFIRIDYDKA